MALITVCGLSVDFGEFLLFDNMNFEIQKGDKVGLIGVNGCGKTTLFRILTGEVSPSGGTVAIDPSVTVGYMEQYVCRSLERSAYEEVLSVFSDLLDMEAELEGLNAVIGTVSSELNEMVERQSFLHDEFTRRGGLTCRSRARSALLGLGFDDDRMNLPISALSGGQRARLQLAKLLLSDADMLLLDEPTNHLDTASVEWLEEYLTESGKSYMVISHDRYFLDKTTNRIFEIENKKMTRYSGNYSAYLPKKQEHDLSVRRAYDNTVKEIERLEGIVEQQRRWNREKNIRTAESAPQSIHFDLSAKTQSGEDVLELDKVTLGFGGEPVFRDVSFEVHRGERIFILGPNGCGKTSLLKAILGKYRVQSGKIRYGAGVKTGYYDQIQSGLDSEKTVFEELSDTFPAMTNTEIRSILARFLFKGDDVFKCLSALSGGERARVLLSELMLQGANLLFLDEPTNHLDINSCAALQQALDEYDGTLLIVSHDRYLINALADKILYLTPTGIQTFGGSYEEFLKKADPFKKTEVQKPKKAEKQTEYKNKKEQDAQRRRDRVRLGKVETEIAEKEDLIRSINEYLNSPDTASCYEMLMKLTEELTAAERELEMLYSEWERLSESVG